VLIIQEHYMQQKSRTITFTVNRKTGEVFDAILNIPPKMFPDAVKNNDGWWMFQGPHGEAKLKFQENAELGILDHVFEDPEGKWDVPMRVVSNGEFSEVVITLFKPPNFTDELFEERAKEIEGIMQKMKEAIEN